MLSVCKALVSIPHYTEKRNRGGRTEEVSKGRWVGRKLRGEKTAST